MKFSICTLFPEMFQSLTGTSIIGRACEQGLIDIRTCQIRDYSADDKHHKVDDYTYGGGAGMLMQAQPVYDCVQAALRENPHPTASSTLPPTGSLALSGRQSAPVESPPETRTPQGEGSQSPPPGGRVSVVRPTGEGASTTHTIYLTPQGRPFNQDMAREFARAGHLVLICGHYEGIDERALDALHAERVSVGDYVLTGGELAAMVIVDAVSRLIPGVLSNEESAETESFDDGLLEYPQYTRPEVWHDMRVPEILLSGDHAKVDAWRKEQSVARTKSVRPDLYQKWAEKNGLSASGTSDEGT